MQEGGHLASRDVTTRSEVVRIHALGHSPPGQTVDGRLVNRSRSVGEPGIGYQQGGTGVSHLGHGPDTGLGGQYLELEFAGFDAGEASHTGVRLRDTGRTGAQRHGDAVAENDQLRGIEVGGDLGIELEVEHQWLLGRSVRGRDVDREVEEREPVGGLSVGRGAIDTDLDGATIGAGDLGTGPIVLGRDRTTRRYRLAGGGLGGRFRGCWGCGPPDGYLSGIRIQGYTRHRQGRSDRDGVVPLVEVGVAGDVHRHMAVVGQRYRRGDAGGRVRDTRGSSDTSDLRAQRGTGVDGARGRVTLTRSRSFRAAPPVVGGSYLDVTVTVIDRHGVVREDRVSDGDVTVGAVGAGWYQAVGRLQSDADSVASEGAVADSEVGDPGQLQPAAATTAGSVCDGDLGEVRPFNCVEHDLGVSDDILDRQVQRGGSDIDGTGEGDQAEPTVGCELKARDRNAVDLAGRVAGDADRVSRGGGDHSCIAAGTDQLEAILVQDDVLSEGAGADGNTAA
ncbi:MAG: hypothetical protein WD467_02370 [Candidatus Saccharimonadales bacterium]